jgi:archaellum component FlaC
VLQKRFGTNAAADPDAQMAALETARAASTPGPGVEDKPSKKSDDEKLSIFWRVFGGAILSVCALIILTLFNNLYSNITELRNELNREREARAEFIRKDDFNMRTSSLYDRIGSTEGLKAELEGLRERVSGNVALIESVKRDSTTTLETARKELAACAENMRKDAAALEVVKERVVNLEAMRKELASIETLKERLSALTSELKATRDEMVKIQQEIEKNKIGDMERKAARDAQYKQVEDALRELQKGLQDSREKLARLEGMQPLPNTPRPVPSDPPMPAPVPPSTPKSWFPTTELPPRSTSPGEAKGSSGGDAKPATSKPGPGDT